MRVFEGSEGPCYFWPKTAVQATLCSTHCCDVGTGLVYAIWLDVSISCLPRDALGSQHRSTDHHLIWGNELLVDSSLHVQEIDALDIAPDLPCFLWLQWGWILPLGWLQLCLSFHPPVMTWDMKFQLFSDVLLSSLNQVVMLSKEDIFDSGCLMFSMKIHWHVAYWLVWWLSLWSYCISSTLSAILLVEGWPKCLESLSDVGPHSMRTTQKSGCHSFIIKCLLKHFIALWCIFFKLEAKLDAHLLCSVILPHSRIAKCHWML